MSLNLTERPVDPIDETTPIPSLPSAADSHGSNRRHRRLAAAIVVVGLLVALAAGALLRPGTSSEPSGTTAPLDDMGAVAALPDGGPVPDLAPAAGDNGPAGDRGSVAPGTKSGTGTSPDADSGTDGPLVVDPAPPVVGPELPPPPAPVPAVIGTSPEALHFGLVTTTLALTVKNTGGTSAMVVLGSVSPWLSVPAAGKEVGPGGEASFDVKVSRQGMAPSSQFSGNVLVQVDGQQASVVPVDGSVPAQVVIVMPSISDVDYSSAVCGTGQGNFKTFTDITVKATGTTSVKLKWTRGNTSGSKNAVYDQATKTWKTTLGGFAAGLPVSFTIEALGPGGLDTAGPFQMQVKVC